MPSLRIDRDLDPPMMSGPVPNAESPGRCPDPLDAVEIARTLRDYAPMHAGIEKTLGHVIESSLANPGCAVRYRLTYLTAVARGQGGFNARLLACAVEYFHVASLLFDDLPQMDDAMERRGQICLHLLHGENAVILGALGLIARAYALIGEAIVHASAETRLAIHAQVERCLGTAGVINGQARDLKFTAGSRGTGGPIAIALGKTVPLLTLAMVAPGRLGNAQERDIRLLRKLSIYWGLYYQGLDDLKDLLERTQTSGKTSGRDVPLGRPNIAHTLGIAQTRAYLRRLERLAESCIVKITTAHLPSRFLFAFQLALTQRLESLVQ